MWKGSKQILRRVSTTTAPVIPIKQREISKILIANRGEIACRVIKTARKMGIKTVAIYSEADAQALHVRMADESICVGPAPSNQSYLNIDEIMKAIKSTGAEAVHPGYGFLSENFKFCERLTEEGVEFIGPSVNSIHLMGDKIESKLIAKAAGVHTIPGFDGVVPDAEAAVKISENIGYPVMIKASAGGGGKGMRIAWNDQEVRENFKIAATESKSSFGDDRLLFEKFIEEPRHIEIQLIGDKHGNIIYLPERECSIQRRNQKVIEEAPSVAIDPETRKKMGEQAVQLARKVGYFSAGTVEFLVDSKKNFYFLEMNTRLQVEHPITEYITGLDLVEQMIRVARGERLSFTQEDVKIVGWAVESRVYAEDSKLYLPCIGRLVKYNEPPIPADKSVRCDTGIVEGSEISIYYDPLICKLSTFGNNREEALARMESALDSYVIRGVTHNIPLLREVIGHEKFKSGKFSTKFLSEHFPHGFDGHKLDLEEREILEVIACHVHRNIYSCEGLNKFYVRIHDSKLEEEHNGGNMNKFVCVDSSSDGYKVVVSQSQAQKSDAVRHPLNVIHWNGVDPLIKYNDTAIEIVKSSKSAGIGFELRLKGTVYKVDVLSDLEFEYFKYMKTKSTKSDTSNQLISPMPGQVMTIHVKEGELVKQGTDLVVIEAMKMQNVLKALRPAKIKRILVTKGQSVGAEEVLIEFEPITAQ